MVAMGMRDQDVVAVYIRGFAAGFGIAGKERIGQNLVLSIIKQKT